MKPIGRVSKMKAICYGDDITQMAQFDLVNRQAKARRPSTAIGSVLSQICLHPTLSPSSPACPNKSENTIETSALSVISAVVLQPFYRCLLLRIDE
jgi:hypothetical protein